MSDPISPRQMLANAQRDVKLHQFDRAIERLEPLLNNRSSLDPAAMMCLVRAHYGAGNLTRAIEYCGGLGDCGVDWIRDWAQAYLKATLIPAARAAAIDLSTIPNCDLPSNSPAVNKIDFNVPDSALFWEFVCQEIAPIHDRVERARRQLPWQISIAGSVATILGFILISCIAYLAANDYSFPLFLLLALGCFSFCSKSFLVFAHSAISSYLHHPERSSICQRIVDFIDGGANKLFYNEFNQPANSDREMAISELFADDAGRKVELFERDCIQVEWDRHQVHIGHYHRSSAPYHYRLFTSWWDSLSEVLPLLMLNHPASVVKTIARGCRWFFYGIGSCLRGQPIGLNRLLESAFSHDINTKYLDRGIWICIKLYGCKVPEIQAISNRVSPFDWRHLLHLDRGELVMTDDKYFDRSFTVRAKSPSLSRDLFSRKLCDLLLKLHTDYLCDVDFRAIDNRIYLKLGIDRDWFTPKLFTNMRDLQPIVDYLGLMTTTIAAIVEMLDSSYLDRQTISLPSSKA